MWNLLIFVTAVGLLSSKDIVGVIRNTVTGSLSFPLP
jgi:hypothetical protein